MKRRLVIILEIRKYQGRNTWHSTHKALWDKLSVRSRKQTLLLLCIMRNKTVRRRKEGRKEWRMTKEVREERTKQ